ncbi:MAG: hypothetical protein KDH16_22775 [Rhodocyclaceae bacterium]|nr:hypothetical protein [Rhodocyclaceae bacterium]
MSWPKGYKMPRLSIEPLIGLVNATYGPDLDITTMARHLGVSASSIYRWRLQGGCSIWSADEMATRLGLHPTAVWGDEYFAVGATVGVA